jgi:hypothetical protein
MKKLLIAFWLTCLSVPALAQDNKVKILDWKCGNEITGIAQNTTSKDLNYVQIVIPLYKADVKVADALANVSGIDAGGKWAFKAIVITQDFDKCGAPKVTAY